MTAVPVGEPVASHAAPRPERVTLEGRFGRLRPLDPGRDAEALYDAVHGPEAEALWAYLAAGPFATKADFAAQVAKQAVSEDPMFFAVADRDDRALGWLSLMRIDPPNRVIEVGWILYSPALQRTALATEAQYLAMAYAFETLGNRRYEWKCNDLNAPSKRAATRFGFTHEGLFRQAGIVKGRNRDTAWYSILDSEWAQRKLAFETFLTSDNMDGDGRQRMRLSVLNETEGRAGGVLLRRASTADLVAIAALKTASYLPNETITGAHSYPRMVNYADVIRDHEIWVVDGPGRLDACAVLKPGREFLVYSLAVHPARQGDGLGKVLLAFAEERARRLKSTEMTLYTNGKLTARIDWYGRHGFVVEREEPLADRIVVHMRKRLMAG